MDKAQKNEPDAVGVLSHGQPAEQSSRKNQMMVVGIGASAGGLAALQAFFEAVAPDLGVAFVVIVHLHPAHRSEMAAILQAHTALPVVQVTATVGLEPNHMYVIPPNKLQLTHNFCLSAKKTTPPIAQKFDKGEIA